MLLQDVRNVVEARYDHPFKLRVHLHRGRIPLTGTAFIQGNVLCVLAEAWTKGPELMHHIDPDAIAMLIVIPE
ncbi:hypothetical protein H4CHR_02914 [Variovorax sp. PBS-H4]|uniref:hypothetical protein n=1 Tax=Variovorax sp. PBS-H4 TaxID=434008 RepID=UPI0013176CB1|nr:hypothetical protein [Variovorax sp. PBS-H4]VTU31964.1 hypothetical protein H4CHR_02914 [Variovorax sp. PBS-H4]